MGPAYFIITVMGCADGAASCQQVATSAMTYDSRAACVAAAPDALMANSDLDFPTLLAECRPSARKSSTSAEPDRLPEGARRG